MSPDMMPDQFAFAEKVIVFRVNTPKGATWFSSRPEADRYVREQRQQGRAVSLDGTEKVAKGSLRHERAVANAKAVRGKRAIEL